jgi:hypothetical protein
LDLSDWLAINGYTLTSVSVQADPLLTIFAWGMLTTAGINTGAWVQITGGTVGTRQVAIVCSLIDGAGAADTLVVPVSISVASRVATTLGTAIALAGTRAGQVTGLDYTATAVAPLGGRFRASFTVASKAADDVLPYEVDAAAWLASTGMTMAGATVAATPGVMLSGGSLVTTAIGKIGAWVQVSSGQAGPASLLWLIRATDTTGCINTLAIAASFQITT